MARPLTARQQQVYDFIHDRISTRGYGPTVREIGEFIGIKSPNGVMCHLRALERKGMINRLANKSRAIELTNIADGAVVAQPSRLADGSLTLRGCVTESSCSLFAAPQPFDLMASLNAPTDTCCNTAAIACASRPSTMATCWWLNQPLMELAKTLNCCNTAMVRSSYAFRTRTMLNCRRPK